MKNYQNNKEYSIADLMAMRELIDSGEYDGASTEDLEYAFGEVAKDKDTKDSNYKYFSRELNNRRKLLQELIVEIRVRMKDALKTHK